MIYSNNSSSVTNRYSELNSNYKFKDPILNKQIKKHGPQLARLISHENRILENHQNIQNKIQFQLNKLQPRNESLMRIQKFNKSCQQTPGRERDTNASQPSVGSSYIQFPPPVVTVDHYKKISGQFDLKKQNQQFLKKPKKTEQSMETLRYQPSLDPSIRNSFQDLPAQKQQQIKILVDSDQGSQESIKITINKEPQHQLLADASSLSPLSPLKLSRLNEIAAFQKINEGILNAHSKYCSILTENNIKSEFQGFVSGQTISYNDPSQVKIVKSTHKGTIKGLNEIFNKHKYYEQKRATSVEGGNRQKISIVSMVQPCVFSDKLEVKPKSRYASRSRQRAVTNNPTPLQVNETSKEKYLHQLQIGPFSQTHQKQGKLKQVIQMKSPKHQSILQIFKNTYGQPAPVVNRREKSSLFSQNSKIDKMSIFNKKVSFIDDTKNQQIAGNKMKISEIPKIYNRNDQFFTPGYISSRTQKQDQEVSRIKMLSSVKKDLSQWESIVDSGMSFNHITPKYKYDEGMERAQSPINVQIKKLNTDKSPQKYQNFKLVSQEESNNHIFNVILIQKDEQELQQIQKQLQNKQKSLIRNIQKVKDQSCSPKSSEITNSRPNTQNELYWYKNGSKYITQPKMMGYNMVKLKQDKIMQVGRKTTLNVRDENF